VDYGRGTPPSLELGRKLDQTSLNIFLDNGSMSKATDRPEKQKEKSESKSNQRHLDFKTMQKRSCIKLSCPPGNRRTGVVVGKREGFGVQFYTRTERERPGTSQPPPSSTDVQSLRNSSKRRRSTPANTSRGESNAKGRCLTMVDRRSACILEDGRED